MRLLNIRFIHVFILLSFASGIFCLTSCSGKPYAQGKNLYTVHCSNCHGEDGKGLKQNIPPLAGSEILLHNREMIPCIIHNGLQKPIVINGKTFGDVAMPAIPTLNEIEIANLMNFLNNTWGDPAVFTQTDEVEKWLISCQK